MARRSRRTLRQLAEKITYRPPKNYIDAVVETSIASGRTPNELGQIGMMLVINHKFFDFDKRLNEVEQHVAQTKKVVPEVFRIGKVLDSVVGGDE